MLKVIEINEYNIFIKINYQKNNFIHLLFCKILKSGESSIKVPSLYHSTLGDGAPFTLHSKTTSWPSEADKFCNICNENIVRAKKCTFLESSSSVEFSKKIL